MKRLKKPVVLLFFPLIMVFLFQGIYFNTLPASAQTLPETPRESMGKTVNTLFIISEDFYTSEVAKYYELLHSQKEHLTIETVYSTSIYAAIQHFTSKIKTADQIITFGLIPSKEELDELKASAKANMKLYAVATDSKYYSEVQIDIILARTLWTDLYYARIADLNQLPFHKPNTNTAKAADFALAVYLQNYINNNSCADITYQDISSKVNLKEAGIDESFYDSVRKFVINNKYYPVNTDIPVLSLKENKPELIYTQKTYDIFKQLYDPNSDGVFSMERTPDKMLMSFEIIRLSGDKNDDTVKKKQIYTWNGKKWKRVTSGITEQNALRVFTWSNGKFNEKVYLFTNSGSQKNPLKTYDAKHIQKDEAGNWYMTYATDNYTYIVQLDKTLKLKYKVNVSKVTDTIYSRFYLLSGGKVLLETFVPADYDYGKSDLYYRYYNEGLKLYKNLQLLDLKTGKITKEYDTGYYPSGYVKIKDKYIYMRDRSTENIIVINSETGKAVKRIYLDDYDYLIQPHKYSEELGGQYDYHYAISGNYLYLLKKSGIYRINLDSGSFSKLVDDSKIPFGIQDMRFLDFEVISSKIYLMTVFFDNECAEKLHVYTKK